MSVKPYLFKLDISKPREKAIYDYLEKAPKKHTIMRALELLMKLEGHMLDNVIQQTLDNNIPPLNHSSSKKPPSTTMSDGFPDFDS